MAKWWTTRCDDPVRQADRAIVATLLMAGLAARVVLSWQSPWYDEICWIQDYIGRSWADALAGTYLPNNHLLYTVIAKLLHDVTLSVQPQLMRLPAEAAGLWIPWLLAAGCRREDRPLALLIVACATLHPWLLSFRSEARGYTLMLALTLLATNLLADAQSRLSWRYTLAMAGAILTIPIAGLALPGHCVASLRQGRASAARWMLSASCALLLSGLLYLPQFAGAVRYFGSDHGAEHGLSLPQLLPQVMWHAVAGFCAGPVGVGWAIFPIVALLGVVAWRLVAARDVIVTCAVAAVLNFAIVTVVPGAGQVRFVLWVIPLVTLGLASLVAWALHHAHLRVMALAGASLLVASGLAAIPLFRTPAQPIKDAVEWAYARSQQDHRYLVGAGLASFDVYRQFGALTDAAYDLPQLRLAEQAGANRVRLLVFYPQAVADGEPQMWSYIQAHYTLEADLPGRVSNCQVLSRAEP